MNEVDTQIEDALEDVYGRIESKRELKSRVSFNLNKIGGQTCTQILEWYQDDENKKWTKEDTQTIIEYILLWCEENGIDSKFKDTHVSYYRSNLKKEGHISY